MIKNRASSSSHASSYKIQGHKDEEEFSSLLEGKIIKGTGKADFIDKNGKQYSIKGGAKKWQIFLYSRNRFLNDQDLEDEILNERINASKKYSIEATPTIFINEKKYSGQHNYEDFKKAILKYL